MTMRMMPYLIALLVCLAPLRSYADNIMPEHSLLWNNFLEIKAVDDYLVGLSYEGLALFAFDSTTELFYQTNQMFLPGIVRNSKLFGSTLVVRLADNRLEFLDLSSLPAIAVLGEIVPDKKYSDYAMADNFIYLSHWFGGVSQYELNGFNSISHVVTDSTGVLMTQLEYQDGYLFALDMYNGLVRYDLNADFGSRVSRLLVRQRPFAFTKIDSAIFVSLNSRGLLIGKFENDSGLIVDSLPSMVSPSSVLNLQDELILLSERNAAVLSKSDHRLLAELKTESHRTKGDIFTINGQERLALPNEKGGVTLFGVDTGQTNQELLGRPGAVSAVAATGSRIITGGNGNPLESYELDSAGIYLSEVLSGGSSQINEVAISTDKLYALSTGGKTIEIYNLTADSSYKSDIFDIRDGSLNILIGSADSIVYTGGRDFIDRYQLLAGSYELTDSWRFETPVSSYTVSDSFLYVANRSGQLSVFEIKSEGSLSLCSVVQLAGTAWKLIESNGEVLVFVYNTMMILNGCNVLANVIPLGLPVLDAVMAGDTLYTIGTKGMAVYDMMSDNPVLIKSSSLRGNLIAVESGLIATSDGSALHVYRLMPDSSAGITRESEKNISARLLDNYPDPFNNSTVIQYELTRQSHVQLSVFNLLGQQVIELVNSLKPAGKHFVNWNGRNQNGNTVASGVYFYRLKTDSTVLSKKMLLLK